MKIILQSIRLLFVLTVLTGILYPLVVTFFAHVAWSEKAEGSLIIANKRAVGSELLAQKTEDNRYFWPRPSAADYATIASGASNLGPSSTALKKAVEERTQKWREANELSAETPVPSDIQFASGSGLDPHISPLAAAQQIQRVAAARNLSLENRAKLTTLVKDSVEGPQWQIFGESRVNVLKLNLAMDRLLFSPQPQ
ncbi:MAG: potassium-transporting ATPase subunit C [Verrucomicrobia bacterium Tous-C9LFEB]|nr:MAG: potassium-transporting ATPase subunit C [Verrucomicrobia bacterium Tous-C9LFEB]